MSRRRILVDVPEKQLVDEITTILDIEGPSSTREVGDYLGAGSIDWLRSFLRRMARQGKVARTPPQWTR